MIKWMLLPGLIVVFLFCFSTLSLLTFLCFVCLFQLSMITFAKVFPVLKTDLT